MYVLNVARNSSESDRIDCFQEMAGQKGKKMEEIFPGMVSVIKMVMQLITRDPSRYTKFRRR